MRASQKSNRQRGRGRGNKPSGNVVNRVFESAGPEGKVRGTPQQIIDKYLALARDAQTSGDRVMTENFLQHAEHYQRMLIAAQAAMQPERREASDEQPQPAAFGSGERPEMPVAAEASVRHEPPAPAASGMDMIEPTGGRAEAALVATPEEGTSMRPNGGGEGADDGIAEGGARPRRRRRSRPVETAPATDEEAAPAARTGTDE